MGRGYPMPAGATRPVRPTRLRPFHPGDHRVVTEAGAQGEAMRRLRLRCPAVLAELLTGRRRVQRWAQANGLPEDVVVDLQLALGEAVSNGIEHAYPQEVAAADIEVDLELCAGDPEPVVTARVSDRGRWRPVPASPGYRGRGLALIARLSRDMRVHRTRRGTLVTFAIPVVGLRWPGPPAVAGEPA